MAKSLSWVPVRRGNHYCSSACRGGCTHADYLKARAEAKQLATSCPGFKPHVWENLGWHHEVVNTAGITIRQLAADAYSASTSLGINFTGSTPREALWGLQLYLQRHADDYTVQAAMLRRALNKLNGGNYEHRTH